MEIKEIDIRNKTQQELVEIYKKIAQQVETCNKLYAEKKDLEKVYKIIKRVKGKDNL